MSDKHDVAQIITLSAGGHIDAVKRPQWSDVHYELETKANISVIGLDFLLIQRTRKSGLHTYIRITRVK